MNPRTKIGAVSYLNTKPLVVGLSDTLTDHELIFDLPSRLADRLAANDLDVALIPVIEAIAHPEYQVVSDACIACRGPVWSVKLFSRVPVKQIKTLALDEGSRTSQTLTRALLAQKYNLHPQCHILSIDEDWTQTRSDAALVIGDRAMHSDAHQFAVEIDLGQAWHDWTGKPFVFAVWAARPGANLDRLGNLLSTARDTGLQQLERLARENAPAYRLSTAACLQYLEQNIHYHLGEAEKIGMQHYFDVAAQLSLIPDTASLRFHESPVS